MLWVATQDEHDQVYYFNRVTDEVQWEDPKEYTAMQDQLEDMMRIQQAHGVQTCIRIGLHAVLREVLQRWYRTAIPRGTRFLHPESSGKAVAHVRAMAKALDAWMQARNLCIKRTAELFCLREKIKQEVARTRAAENEAARCATELAKCKLELAEFEFLRLAESARSSRIKQ